MSKTKSKLPPKPRKSFKWPFDELWQVLKTYQAKRKNFEHVPRFETSGFYFCSVIQYKCFKNRKEYCHVFHAKWIWGFDDFCRCGGICPDYHERRQKIQKLMDFVL